MRSVRLHTLLSYLLAAMLLAHSVAGPARCLAHMAPHVDLAAMSAMCGTPETDSEDDGAALHATDHVCAVCCVHNHAVAPTPMQAPAVTVAWVLTAGPSLLPAQGPSAPRAPPLQPRAPPPVS